MSSLLCLVVWFSNVRLDFGEFRSVCLYVWVRVCMCLCVCMRDREYNQILKCYKYLSLCLLNRQNVTLKRDWQCCKMDELWEHAQWKNPVTKDHIFMWFHLYEMYKKGTSIETSMEKNRELLLMGFLLGFMKMSYNRLR